MRDPKRIPKFILEIQKVWEKMPDLRFGQFLWTIFTNGKIPFSMEDDDFINLMGKIHKVKVKKIKVFQEGTG